MLRGIGKFRIFGLATYLIFMVASFAGCAKKGAIQTETTPPTVLAMVPANNSVSVAATSLINVSFSEVMDPSTINTSTFTLKQGTTVIAGVVTYSGTSATFTPTSNLSANTIYTATVTTGVKDAAGNAIAGNVSWNFTTATLTDIVPPTVLSVVPASGATSISLSSTVTASFSEAMTASTLTSATFSLNQGTTNISGTVSYSGTTATFTPTSSLTGGLVYTATISTGAKDLAGNAIAAAKVWSFTTLASTSLSFASDVIPVLNLCNNCHTHGWTTSNVASTFYANLVSKGYVNATTYTSAKIYTKIIGGHPGSGSISTANTDKIINWMKAGSVNN